MVVNNSGLDGGLGEEQKWILGCQVRTRSCEHVLSRKTVA